MKTAIYLLVLLGALSCQRNKEVNPKDFQLIEGKWEQTGHQVKRNNEKTWVKDSTSGKVSLIIRADGVPLDENGEGFCCWPENYLLNGKLYSIKPKAPVEKAGVCISASCVYCETVELQATETSLLLIYCGGSQITYRKLP